MVQTKLFSAQHKAKEELEMRYKNVLCLFNTEVIDGKTVFEQYTCYNNDTERDVIQVQFRETVDGSVSVMIYKLTQLASHKI